MRTAIPDGNVLGFDPYMVNTYHEDELRENSSAHLGVKRIEEIENDDAEDEDLTENSPTLKHMEWGAPPQ